MYQQLLEQAQILIHLTPEPGICGHKVKWRAVERDSCKGESHRFAGRSLHTQLAVTYGQFVDGRHFRVSQWAQIDGNTYEFLWQSPFFDLEFTA